MSIKLLHFLHWACYPAFACYLIHLATWNWPENLHTARQIMQTKIEALRLDSTHTNYAQSNNPCSLCWCWVCSIVLLKWYKTTDCLCLCQHLMLVSFSPDRHTLPSASLWRNSPFFSLKQTQPNASHIFQFQQLF